MARVSLGTSLFLAAAVLQLLSAPAHLLIQACLGANLTQRPATSKTLCQVVSHNRRRLTISTS